MLLTLYYAMPGLAEACQRREEAVSSLILKVRGRAELAAELRDQVLEHGPSELRDDVTDRSIDFTNLHAAIEEQWTSAQELFEKISAQPARNQVEQAELPLDAARVYAIQSLGGQQVSGDQQRLRLLVSRLSKVRFSFFFGGIRYVWLGC